MWMPKVPLWDITKVLNNGLVELVSALILNFEPEKSQNKIHSYEFRRNTVYESDYRNGHNARRSFIIIPKPNLI